MTFLHATDGTEPNAILTFVDQADGRRWLAGAIVGPLMLEGDTDEQMEIADTIDRVLVLASFKAITRNRGTAD